MNKKHLSIIGFLTFLVTLASSHTVVRNPFKKQQVSKPAHTIAEAMLHEENIFIDFILNQDKISTQKKPLQLEKLKG
jgi:hypothetical protein